MNKLMRINILIILTLVFGIFFNTIVLAENNNNSVKVLCASIDKSYKWFGTSAGLVSYLPKENKWVIYNKEDGLPDNWVSALKVTSTILWVGTPKGIVTLDKRSNKIYLDERLKRNTSRDYITSIETTGDLLWIGTWNNLKRYNKVTGEIKSLFKKRVAVNKIKLIDDDIYIGTREGLYIYKKAKDEIKRPIDNIILSEANITDITNSKTGIWIATDGDGLLYFNKQDNKWYQFRKRNGLLSNFITGISADDANIWIGTSKEGIQSYNFITKKWIKYSTNELLNKYVRTIITDAKGVWFGFDADGLIYRYSKWDNVWFKFKVNIGNVITLGSSGIKEKASSKAFKMEKSFIGTALKVIFILLLISIAIVTFYILKKDLLPVISEKKDDFDLMKNVEDKIDSRRKRMSTYDQVKMKMEDLKEIEEILELDQEVTVFIRKIEDILTSVVEETNDLEERLNNLIAKEGTMSEATFERVKRKYFEELNELNERVKKLKTEISEYLKKLDNVRDTVEKEVVFLSLEAETNEERYKDDEVSKKEYSIKKKELNKMIKERENLLKNIEENIVHLETLMKKKAA